ncbi:MAG: ABC transporter ATP-binding protein [Acetobacterium sp.]
MIEIINLTKCYGKNQAVKNLNFVVEEGEVLGFLGPNGSGKSTTMNIITGYLPSTEGTVKVCGVDILENPREAKKHIGYLPENNPLYPNMTITEFLNFTSDLKVVSKKQKKSQLDNIMDIVNLTEVKDRLIRNLSKGYKQRVGIAQALVGSPDVLILDEPTVGLDPKQIIEIRKLIKGLGKQHTIILSSHILPEVSAVCDRVVIINKGEIVAVDKPDNLSKGFNNCTKCLTTIVGPRHLVKNEILGIDGVNRVEVEIEKSNEVISYIIESNKDIDVRRALFFAMAKSGYPILESKSLDMSLEDIFMQLVTNEKEAE